MHKDFEAAAREADRESLTFTLGGELFTCVPELPAIPVLKLAALADQEGAEAAAAFYSFVRSMLIDADADRFEEVCIRERVSMDFLAEIVKWITENAVGRPTQRPSALAERPSSTSPPSTGGSSRRVIGQAS